MFKKSLGKIIPLQFTMVIEMRFTGGMEDGSGMYQQHGGGTPRSHSTASTASSISPTGNSATPMLIVPHPINAAKITDAHHVVTHQNGGGRKYTCKMCPSVSNFCAY